MKPKELADKINAFLDELDDLQSGSWEEVHDLLSMARDALLDPQAVPPQKDIYPVDANPESAKKAWYYIIIEATDVEDTEYQVEQVTMLTQEMGKLVDFNATIWLDNVTYKT